MWKRIKIRFKKSPKYVWPKLPRDEFRESPTNVAWAITQLNNSPQGQALQAYLLDGLMAQRSFPGDEISQEQAAMAYSRMMGYLDCFHRLQKATVPPPAAVEVIEATYDQTPPDENEDK